MNELLLSVHVCYYSCQEYPCLRRHLIFRLNNNVFFTSDLIILPQETASDFVMHSQLFLGGGVGECVLSYCLTTAYSC